MPATAAPHPCTTSHASMVAATAACGPATGNPPASSALSTCATAGRPMPRASGRAESMAPPVTHDAHTSSTSRPTAWTAAPVGDASASNAIMRAADRHRLHMLPPCARSAAAAAAAAAAEAAAVGGINSPSPSTRRLDRRRTGLPEKLVPLSMCSTLSPLSRRVRTPPLPTNTTL